jgi:hypothetical protein
LEGIERLKDMKLLIVKGTMAKTDFDARGG